jgi:hypothetical protein
MFTEAIGEKCIAKMLIEDVQNYTSSMWKSLYCLRNIPKNIIGRIKCVHRKFTVIQEVLTGGDIFSQASGGDYQQNYLPASSFSLNMCYLKHGAFLLPLCLI